MAHLQAAYSVLPALSAARAILAGCLQQHRSFSHSAAAAAARRHSTAAPGPEPDTEVAVIGAGVIGLAIARELALRGYGVVLLEAAGGPQAHLNYNSAGFMWGLHDKCVGAAPPAGAIGTETSSRNSEVIHAGLYYPVGSLKARLCVAGRRQLYAFCEAHDVPHRRLGKLLVATSPAQLQGLAALQARAAANGVADLRPLSAGEVAALEPAVRCQAALLSPSTGILDSHRHVNECA